MFEFFNSRLVLLIAKFRDLQELGEGFMCTENKDNETVTSEK